MEQEEEEDEEGEEDGREEEEELFSIAVLILPHGLEQWPPSNSKGKIPGMGREGGG